ncbi:MAG: cupin domain-containing protein [Bacteroidetes bacterium]|nr:cupin domain-containing protein [Bacteroidota bacterium]
MKSKSFVHASGLEWEKAGDGVRRKILGYTPGIMMVRVEFRKGAAGYVHTHPHRQVTIVESGKLRVEIEGKTSGLLAGDCFMVEPEVPHGVEMPEDGFLIDVFTPAREDFLEGMT